MAFISKHSSAVNREGCKRRESSGRGATVAKVMADISFLRDRITLMKSQRRPNMAVLQTYRSMLQRRELTLQMLNNGRTPPAEGSDEALSPPA